MADSIASLSKLKLIMSRIRSTYLFDCQCPEMSQKYEFNAISAQPAEAASGKAQVAERKRQTKENFTCQARQRLLRRLVLIYLSTLLILTQPSRRRRLYLTNLQKCLKDKKFCAKRALGRLFRTPLMNWSGTSTSRGLPTYPTTTRSCTGSKVLKPRLQDSSTTALRLEQKTSGLFDTAEAGNKTVAGGVSEPGFEVGRMEPITPESGDFLGGLFQDMPLELTGLDYLDSFMDLSNFLTGDMKEEGPGNDVLVEAADDEMMGKLDFSGILTSLKEEADAFTFPSAEVAQSSAPDQTRKRKLADSEVVEEPYIGNCITVDVMDIEQVPDSSTSDHDYVIKKPRLASTSYMKSEIESQSPIPVSSTIDSTTTPKTKYRERRDKNNAASRRSRQIRKQKFVEMEVIADELEAKNDKLREKIEDLEKLAKFMKAELIKQMTKK